MASHPGVQFARGLPRRFFYALARRLSARKWIIRQLKIYGEQKVVSAAKGVVQAGPFRGMKWAVAGSSWGQDSAGILLGMYEAELHEIIEKIVMAKPPLVVNVGAADGYYSVGLKLRLPETPIIAVDISTASLRQVQNNAKLNGLSVEVSTRMPSNLPSRSVIIMDVEGAEQTLLTDPIYGNLTDVVILVEIHHWVNPRIQDNLVDAFRQSHKIIEIKSAGRNPNNSPILRGLSDDLKWLLMSESRPSAMS